MDTAGSRRSGKQRGLLLALLIAATFLIFFQAFMIAPLIPRLGEILGVSPQVIAVAVPAYLIPYGLMNLVWGPLSDRLGRGRLILGSLLLFVLLVALTGAVNSAGEFIAARIASALGASAVVPVSLALIGDMYEFRERGRPLGWLFGAMAGGIAFGSSAGALLEPVIGWRALFLATAGLAGIVLVCFLPLRHTIFGARPAGRPASSVARGYLDLLKNPRGRHTYAYVLFNAILHSGIYTWLGLYFTRFYGLGEIGIGLAILGYGVPGFLLGPVIGRLADRYGRARLIPSGLAVAGASALALADRGPLVVPVIAVAVLSFGYDLTQPLLAGIVTDLSAERGQAMGLNVFTLFVGFGLGSLAFQALLAVGFLTALNAFGSVALAASLLATLLFRGETSERRT